MPTNAFDFDAFISNQAEWMQGIAEEAVFALLEAAEAAGLNDANISALIRRVQSRNVDAAYRAMAYRSGPLGRRANCVEIEDIGHATWDINYYREHGTFPFRGATV